MTREHVVFRMTGRREGTGLDAVDPIEFRPALLARYRDLTSLRYDYPVVLADNPASVYSLSSIVDRVLQQIGHGDDGERVTRHVLRLERQIRTMVADGARASLSELWQRAASEIVETRDATIAADLDRARAALAIDGEVVDCDRDLPAHMARHAWVSAANARAARFHAEAGRLMRQLSDILRADDANSTAGRTPSKLAAMVGSAHAGMFDFDVMARVLGAVAPATTIPEARRTRIAAALATLESQRLFPQTAVPFTRCTTALGAWRRRMPEITAIARALAIAELEAAGEYREPVHDAFFASFGADGLDAADLARFPDPLVSIGAAALDPVEQTALMEILAAGLPVKVVVQWDDILDESSTGDGHLGFGHRARQLAHMAMGPNEAYVLQAPAALLYRCRARLVDAMTAPGPALISVFSGATGHSGDVPPYLISAAAAESRVFPVVVCDPSAGEGGLSRLHLEDNPQIDRDWPMQPFAYEGERHERITTTLPITLVDFAACDSRAAQHFARVPHGTAAGQLISAADAIAAGPNGRPDMSPALFVVDRRSSLHQVIVDDRLVREARRCREAWRRLQEMGAAPASAPAVVSPKSSVPVEPAPAVSAPPLAEAPATDEPYIETPRCSTCNECTRISPAMFAYNDNKQAYIKNADGGTYAQLVEAAESCQLAIIHPGAPRNPNEPGLDALRERAAAFQ